MEASIAREFIPSQNKAAYSYILIDKRVIKIFFTPSLRYLFFTRENPFHPRSIHEPFAFKAKSALKQEKSPLLGDLGVKSTNY
ncbi:MAG TPA: hypothetical protein VK106_03790 [Balneolaceae bacterium]|nr:hypothetical protein [Balneolaceae bacterium]